MGSLRGGLVVLTLTFLWGCELAVSLFAASTQVASGLALSFLGFFVNERESAASLYITVLASMSGQSL